MFHVKQFEEKLYKYKELLSRYHKTLDLMSDKGLKDLDAKIDDVRVFATQIKSLKSENTNILDIGSGAGLPGVVLAILLPNWRISLVERRQRRASFLTIVKSQLALSNVEIFNTDVKDLKLEPQAVISAQAVTDFYSLYCLSRQVHCQKITLISRKGDGWQDEIDYIKAKIDKNITVHATQELSNDGNLVTISLVGGKKCQLSE